MTSLRCMKKTYTHLSQEQRYQIQALFEAKVSQTEIAKIIGKNKSTISRELKRNTPKSRTFKGIYRADFAIRKTAKRQKEKPKRFKFSLQMKNWILKQMREDRWSPEILMIKGKEKFGEFVSAEWIYQWIWKMKRTHRAADQAFRSLHTFLKHGKRRHKRSGPKTKGSMIKNRVCITERSQVVEERKRLGDLEMDLMLGKDHKPCLLVILDRASLKTQVFKIASKKAVYIRKKINSALSKSTNSIKTITVDNDTAFTEHEKFLPSSQAQVYFARPYTSQDKGSVENRIGVIRQFIPKGTHADTITEKRAKEIEKKLNDRPVRKFNYKTPNQIHNLMLNVALAT